MAIIQAAHYDETVAALANDPIIIEMANEVPGGMPLNWDLIRLSNAEFARRGGTGAAHIGAVAEAIVAVQIRLGLRVEG